jgi:hypothetical protein
VDYSASCVVTKSLILVVYTGGRSTSMLSLTIIPNTLYGIYDDCHNPTRLLSLPFYIIPDILRTDQSIISSV